MLSPEYLETIGEGGEEIAELLHHEIMQQIVERIAIRLDRGDNYILTARDKWQIQVLQDAGYLREDIEKLLAKYTGLMQKEIAEAMEAAGVRNMEWDDAVYRAAGLSPAALSQSPYLVRLMQRAYEATVGEWVNFTRTTADACQQSFVAACDKAYNMVSSGAMGYSQAFVDAIKDLADEGVAVVKYTKIDPISGEEKVHTDTIETATLRCIRTGVSQATAQITDARMDEMNWDIILVSSHFGARVTANEDFTNHYWWQGKFYSKSGKDPRFPPFSVCGFGHVQGIHGANCRHHKGPGDGEHNPFREYDSEENKKEYELQQKQRSKERRIRKTKQQCVTLKKAMNSAETEESKQKLEEAYQKKAALLGRQNEDYNDFCEENNLKRRSERLQIAKWDREQARASIKAEKEYNKLAGEQSPRATKTKKNAVNWSIIQSDGYSQKFAKLSDSKEVNKSAEIRAKWALNNRDGKNTEELYAIDANSGIEIARITDQNHPYGVKRTKQFDHKIQDAKKYGKKIIFIHNHPAGSPPSVGDLNALLGIEGSIGITAGHDGSIYKYTAPRKKVEINDFDIEIMKHKSYSYITAHEKALSELAEKYGFTVERM